MKRYDEPFDRNAEYFFMLPAGAVVHAEYDGQHSTVGTDGQVCIGAPLMNRWKIVVLTPLDFIPTQRVPNYPQ